MCVCACVSALGWTEKDLQRDETVSAEHTTSPAGNPHTPPTPAPTPAPAPAPAPSVL